MAKRQMPGNVYLLVNENFLDANSITRVVYALVKTNLFVCSAFIHALTKIFSFKNVYTKSKKNFESNWIANLFGYCDAPQRKLEKYIDYLAKILQIQLFWKVVMKMKVNVTLHTILYQN